MLRISLWASTRSICYLVFRTLQWRWFCQSVKARHLLSLSRLISLSFSLNQSWWCLVLNPNASLQASVKPVLTWVQCSSTQRLSSGFESSLSCKPPLNWLLVSKSLSLPTSNILLEVCCFRCFGAMRIATLAHIILWSVDQAVEPAIALVERTSARSRCRVIIMSWWTLWVQWYSVI